MRIEGILFCSSFLTIFTVNKSALKDLHVHQSGRHFTKNRSYSKYMEMRFFAGEMSFDKGLLITIRTQYIQPIHTAELFRPSLIGYMALWSVRELGAARGNFAFGASQWHRLGIN